MAITKNTMQKPYRNTQVLKSFKNDLEGARSLLMMSKLDDAVNKYKEFLLTRKTNPLESIDKLRIWLDSEKEFLENGSTTCTSR